MLFRSPSQPGTCLSYIDDANSHEAYCARSAPCFLIQGSHPYSRVNIRCAASHVREALHHAGARGCILATSETHTPYWAALAQEAKEKEAFSWAGQSKVWFRKKGKIATESADGLAFGKNPAHASTVKRPHGMPTRVAKKRVRSPRPLLPAPTLIKQARSESQRLQGSVS